MAFRPLTRWLFCQDETPDILVRVAPFTKQDGKVTPNQNVTFNLVAEPPDLEFANKTSWNPYSPGEFAYVYDIVIPSNDGFTPELDKLGIHSVLFQHSLNLFLNGRAVDSTPDSTISIRFSSPDNFLIPNGTTRLVQSIEASDPRLNHLPNDAGSIWEPSEGTLNKTNSNLYPAWTNAAAKMKYGFAPGTNMYCRNGDMLTPVELGYIPIYNGTPWMTLDIFSEDGVELMNSLVCDSDVWNIMKEHDVFYTNGTINPYTRDPAVLCGAFCGIDIREVPNMPGDPDSKTEVITPATAKEISDEFLKDILPDTKEKYSKAGAAGWMRLLRYKGFDFNKLDGKENLFGLYANKNQRIALAHNTWGLFNESDSLFLVFVVAQSISEAPDKVQAEGDWDEKEDMITGERWAVALCWMDTLLTASYFKAILIVP